MNLLLDKQEYLTDPFSEIMFRLNANVSIPRTLARDAFFDVLTDNSHARDSKLACILIGLGYDNTSSDTLADLIEAIINFEEGSFSLKRESLSKVKGKVIGLAGSGKKGLKTVNISTLSMIVAIASGSLCVKCGSSATSSLVGSFDFAKELGINIPKNFSDQKELFYKTGFGFFGIESRLPNFDSVYGGKFFAPHVLSYVLPAIVMPVVVDALIYGYASPRVDICTRILNDFGFHNNIVVNSTIDTIHYVDEVLSVGVSSIAGTIDSRPGDIKTINSAAYFGITDQKEPSFDQLACLSAQMNFSNDLLQGLFVDSVAENTVCINAGNIVYLSGLVDSPRDGFALCKSNLRSGLAWNTLKSIIKISKEYE